MYRVTDSADRSDSEGLRPSFDLYFITMQLKRTSNYPELYNTCITYPAIDNHGHPLLKVEHRNDMSYESIWSDADPQSPALQDSVHTFACYKATEQLAELFGMSSNDVTWEKVKATARGMDYVDLCNACFSSAHIQCILFDDGLGGVSELAESYHWHDRYTKSPNKRIVRIEVVAEVPTPTTTLSREGEADLQPIGHPRAHSQND